MTTAISRSSWSTCSTVRGDTCIAILDGKNVVDVRLDPAAGDNPVPALRRIKGRIGFQAHTGTIRVRRVQIKELPPTDRVPEHSGEVRFRKVWIDELPPFAETATTPSSRSTSAYRGPWQKFGENEKVHRFWNDYGDALKRYYEQPMPAAMPILPARPSAHGRC